MKNIAPLFVLLLACFLSSCGSTDARIKEKSAVFAALSPADQRTIRRGNISVGFTPDMVYMALDKPESVVPGPGTNEESWMYHNFYSPALSNDAPPTRVRVHFVDGKVTSIDIVRVS